MESRNILIENFQNFVPKNDFDFNFQEAYSKGCSSSDESITLEYLELQKKYDILLSNFFESTLSIEHLDSTLKSIDTINIPETPISKISSIEEYYQNMSHLLSLIHI